MINQIIIPEVFSKPVVAKFSEENTSSDGGLILLKQIDNATGVTKSIAETLVDYRDQRYIEYSLEQLLTQRMYQIIAGYEDGNDSNKLKKDPMLKLIVNNIKDAEDLEDDLASGSTISRLENSISIKDLHNLIEHLVDLYLQRNEKRFKKELKKKKKIKITIDLDPTNITTYGSQQLSFFNGYYDETCYLPLVIADGDNGDLIASILRPGTKHAKFLLPEIMRRLFDRIEAMYKNVEFLIRADSGFHAVEVFKYFESKENVKYEIGLISNNNLKKLIKKEMDEAEKLFKEKNETIINIGEFGYSAESWGGKFRKVIYKIEVNSHKTDIRFLATNDHKNTPKDIKENYNMRANIENRIKELKVQTFAERLSAQEFRTNFFRLLLSSFAFVLYQELRKKIAKTKLANSYVNTMREKLIKISVSIKVTARKIWFLLPKSYPYQDVWESIFCET